MSENETPLEVVFEKLHASAKVPVYASAEAAGADLHSITAISIAPGERAVVGTGLALRIPPGYEGQIRPRSGLAAKSGITVLNTPGTIDSDYRGEIGVILINHSPGWFTIEKGDRIAQIVFAPVMHVAFSKATVSAEETERGADGFGSTGV